jgi:hypothetical protein
MSALIHRYIDHQIRRKLPSIVLSVGE